MAQLATVYFVLGFFTSALVHEFLAQNNLASMQEEVVAWLIIFALAFVLLGLMRKIFTNSRDLEN